MPAPLPEVRASRFVLVDAKGKDRIVMEMVGDQPAIKLLGKNGYTQVALRITGDDAADMILASPNGETTARMVASGDLGYAGTATIVLGAGRHKRLTATTGRPPASPSIVLIDDAQRTTAQLPPPVKKLRKAAAMKPNATATVAKKK